MKIEYRERTTLTALPTELGMVFAATCEEKQGVWLVTQYGLNCYYVNLETGMELGPTVSCMLTNIHLYPNAKVVCEP